MKKRSTEILQRLLQAHGSGRVFRTAHLAREYHVTERTLRNDVAEINRFLYDIHVEELLLEDGKLTIPAGFDSEVVRRELYAMDAYLYRFSPEEREIYIEATLIRHAEYLSMQRLADALYVNRATISGDFECVRDALFKSGVTLTSDAGKGIRLDCTEEVRIELLARLFRRIAVSLENHGFFQRYVLKHLKIRHPFSKIFSILSEYTTANSLVFVDDTFYEIALYLFAFFHIRKPKAPAAPPDAKGLESMMLYAAAVLKEPVTAEEIGHFRDYLLRENLGAFVKSIDELDLYKVIRFFLQTIDKELHLNLTTDAVLIDALLLHIKRLKNWGKVDITMPAADAAHGVSIDYEKLLAAVERHAPLLERFLTYALSDNMKKSIVIHICVALIRNHRYTSQLTVAVVCPGSMATGKYLEAQLKNYFDFCIAGVYPAADVLTELKARGQHVDLILSTVPIETEEYRVLKVHPFLSMEDMNRIQAISFACQRHAPGAAEKSDAAERDEERFLSGLHALMKSEGLPAQLERDIEKVVRDYAAGRRKKSAASELLRRAYVIEEERPALDWKEAMRLSARPLEEAGCIEAAYIEAAIAHVEAYGDYIVISRGVALAHAGKDCGVRSDALSLLVSRPGILCSDGETKVHLLFCFATTGEREYLRLLKELVAIGQREGYLEKLLALPLDAIYEELAYAP